MKSNLDWIYERPNGPLNQFIGCFILRLNSILVLALSLEFLTLSTENKYC